MGVKIVKMEGEKREYIRKDRKTKAKRNKDR